MPYLISARLQISIGHGGIQKRARLQNIVNDSEDHDRPKNIVKIITNYIDHMYSL